ncbi:MAG: amidohydrolase family protein [Nitrospirae bacterium]|nr:amidohydrolase family protein [Candidatus Manganitrophaceae bacterium]
MEDKIGTLEVGKLADVIILDQNLIDIPAEKISDTVVNYTFVDGEMVHKRTLVHLWQDIKIWIFGEALF